MYNIWLVNFMNVQNFVFFVVVSEQFEKPLFLHIADVKSVWAMTTVRPDFWKLCISEILSFFILIQLKQLI